mmetsp:Transcript_22049/g.54111  ORF Transcript_22049/g.54111 Transcript_22049/m.54111 type:complete len:375 (-) Transcript_22049:327-1451(-)
MAGFGRASDGTSSRVVGTPHYMAPQVWQGQYDGACDLWSVGVVTYVLLSGTQPFPGASKQQISDKVMEGRFRMDGPQWKAISDDAKDLIRKLLRYDARERLTAEQALLHPWIDRPQPFQPLTREMVSSLRAFCRETRLTKAVLMTVASQVATEALVVYQQVFEQLDTDGDGTITLPEMEDALATHPELQEIGLSANQMFEELDTDGSGRVEYTEWLAAVIDKSLYEGDNILSNTFRIFDQDGNGLISASDLRDLLLTDEVARRVEEKHGEDEFFRRLDSDISTHGSIDFARFVDGMRQHAREQQTFLLTTAAAAAPVGASAAPSAPSSSSKPTLHQGTLEALSPTVDKSGQVGKKRMHSVTTDRRSGHTPRGST